MPNQPYDRRAGFHGGPRHNGKGAVGLPRLPLLLLRRADVIE
ncbi:MULTISPECIES: hypothetical protein [unclassified Bradyrhizobium]|nr:MULTISPECIES: hypothetical protein [unclassified Bradyrhizobium]